MKKLLVIGSTVVDVIIPIHHLPRTAEDVNVYEQRLAMGGCAYNAWSMLRHFGVPAILFSPVGTGVYGDFVRTGLAAQGASSPIPTPQRENGCCYCFVEKGGERTFVSVRGAEYAFRREWFDGLDLSDVDGAYLCGLEVEDPSGGCIIDFLEDHRELRVYFAPGPRIRHLQRDRLERILDLHPVLHLNEEEAVSAAADLTGVTTSDAAEAAAALRRRTGGAVIVTLGERGCLYDTAEGVGWVPGVRARVTDTIGAGDSHIGTVMARLQQGASMEQALRAANYVSAAVVSVQGARLEDEDFGAVLSALQKEGLA